MKLFLFLSVVWMSTSTAWAQSAQLPQQSDCHLTAKQVADLQELSFQAFDQDSKGGWRLIADHGCRVEAALLIDAYIANPTSDLTEIEKGDLYFHAGQLFALAGENPLAVHHMLHSLNPRESAQNDLVWNTYVLATIGFLQHDKAILESQHHLLAMGKQTRENLINLGVIDGLLRCFDQPYDKAYDVPCRLPVNLKNQN